jgi:hypothetical protein
MIVTIGIFHFSSPLSCPKMENFFKPFSPRSRRLIATKRSINGKIIRSEKDYSGLRSSSVIITCGAVK